VNKIGSAERKFVIAGLNRKGRNSNFFDFGIICDKIMKIIRLA